MKRILLLVAVSGLLTSCSTLFTPAKQTITFAGESGIKIYDDGIKIAEIKEDNTVSVRMQKKLSSKDLIAKKDGYKPTPLRLEARFDVISLANILFWPGFIVDLGTGQMCKWENTYINIDMDK